MHKKKTIQIINTGTTRYQNGMSLTKEVMNFKMNFRQTQ
jgi:hypothetical protein